MSDLPTKSPNEGEELVQTDDRLVGKAFRWSLLVLLVLGAVAAAGFWAFRPATARVAPRLTPLTAPTAAPTLHRAEIPLVQFVDVTTNAGILHRHENGAYGEKLLPETMGGGVAFFDMDGDGDQDLLFVNSSFWPWKKPDGKSQPPPLAFLYRNDTKAGGPILFHDVTAGSGFEIPFYGGGVAIGDYDADGKEDVLITGVGGARLFHNEGTGRFTDVTAKTGVGGDPHDWSTASVWFDMDNDGDLDLFVGNYVRWSREIDAEVGYKLTGGARAYGPPMNFGGAFPHLYRNDGQGKFTDVSAAAGVQVRNPATGVPAAKTLGVVAIDLNGDGWTDLVVANDTVQNFVFENQHNGTFKEIGALTGIAFDSYGNTRGAMGIDAARFTPDGKLAVAIGNFANEMTAFYVAQPDPMLFTDEAIAWGIGGPSRDPLKFGVFFFDYDLDGRLDLLSCNGHLEEEIAKIQKGQQYQQPAQLFWNGGDSGLQLVTSKEAGADLFQPIVGRGSAYADIDGDGDLDVVLTQVGGRPLLLRNDQSLDHHWCRVKLASKSGNRDALGAWVHFQDGDKSAWRYVTSTRGYLSASELPITLGLGRKSSSANLEITWPGGKKQLVNDVPIGQVRVIEEIP